jgi:hypothetical protein
MVDETPHQVCPRCGLSLRPRMRWMTVQYCPRCIAFARIPVRMTARDPTRDRPRRSTHNA